MTWVKLDDGLPDHPKVVGLSAEAFAVYVSGICYCSRNLTDGLIPRGALVRLTNAKRPTKAADELVAANLWREHPQGWSVHDYTEHQRSRDEVIDISEKRAQAGAKGAAKRWQLAMAEPSEGDSKSMASAMAKNGQSQSQSQSQSQKPLTSPVSQSVSAYSADGLDGLDSGTWAQVINLAADVKLNRQEQTKPVRNVQRYVAAIRRTLPGEIAEPVAAYVHDHPEHARDPEAIVRAVLDAGPVDIHQARNRGGYT